ETMRIRGGREPSAARPRASTTARALDLRACAFARSRALSLMHVSRGDLEIARGAALQLRHQLRIVDGDLDADAVRVAVRDDLDAGEVERAVAHAAVGEHHPGAVAADLLEQAVGGAGVGAQEDEDAVVDVGAAHA